MLRTLIKTILVFTLIVGLTLLFLQFPVDWSSWRPATCLSLEGCFCEAARPGALRQPVNAWSSYAFVLAGLWIAFDSSSARLRGHPVSTILMAAALAVIGLGSAFYHASLSFAGQFLDVFGMYLLATFLLLFNLNRIKKIPVSLFGAGYLILNAALAVLLLARPEWRRSAFLVIILLAIASELAALWRGSRGRLRWYVAALGCFALAFFVWNLDNSGAWCQPVALLQGHAFWHILGAVAAVNIKTYYQSIPSS